MNRSALEQECRTFSRYLIGRPPDPYVIAKYLDYHARFGESVAPRDAFDAFLTRTARRSPLRARLADTYASRFRKTAAVRKKLVLLLALLETSPAAAETLDRVDGSGVAGAFARLAWRASVYAGSLLLALPLVVLSAVYPRGER